MKAARFDEVDHSQRRGEVLAGTLTGGVPEAFADAVKIVKGVRFKQAGRGRREDKSLRGDQNVVMAGG
jgi:hypothetical protein